MRRPLKNGKGKPKPQQNQQSGASTTNKNEEEVELRRKDRVVRKSLKKGKLEQVESLEELLAYFDIPNSDWDYLIVGDGSGTTWEKEFGWASVLIGKASKERQAFFGSASNGTNNMAEIMAVLHPLMHLSNNVAYAPDGTRTAAASGLKVHIVSDSQYVVNGLKQDNPIWVSKLAVNRELWMAIHMTRRRGLILKSHHIPRDTIDLNKFSHSLANASRRKQIGLLSEINEDVYEVNPLNGQKSRDDGAASATPIQASTSGSIIEERHGDG